MAMTSARPFINPFAGSSHPASPAPTTASSLNYSQYGSTAFQSPARGPGLGGTPPLPNNSGGGGGYGSVSASSGSKLGSGSGGIRNVSAASASSEKKAESREIARVHWRALRDFLASWTEKESPTARASAREKLTRLTKLQFQELSTDVYDELMRRLDAEDPSPEGAPPFLPVRDDFHPKRNQARQKLATLPKNRFKDLASDVFFELRRRYPEFEEAETPNEPPMEYDEPPPAPGPVPLSSNSGKPSYYRHPSNSSLNNGLQNPQMSRLVSESSQHRHQPSNSTHRSHPSRDAEILNDDSKLSRRYSNQPNLNAATNDVVVPNKSRLREEDIEVPYARDSRLVESASIVSGMGGMGGRSSGHQRSESRAESRTSQRDYDRYDDRDRRPDSRASFGQSGSATTPIGPGQVTRRSSINNNGTNDSKNSNGDPSNMFSPAMTNDDRQYYDRMSFSSNLSRTKQGVGGGAGGWDQERESKIREEYEFKVAGLERKVTLAENERDEAKRALTEEQNRRREWEDEVRGLKERSATHASSLRSLQHELDVARDAAEAARQHAQQSSINAQNEIAHWRDRCDQLQDEVQRLEQSISELQALNRKGAGPTEGNGRVIDELKSEMKSLVEELSSLSVRNDELMAEREKDAIGMNEMESKVEEYRKKWEAARIELRNLKATSTMFVSKPLTDDHLPASPDGNIADVNVSAFQNAIDGLLTSARSSHPSGVLPAMKAIVESVSNIGEDVKNFEAKPNLDVDVSRLESLKHESTTRLNALMQAARAHAMASGLSPVSLIDAAAGHLSANVVEIIKLLKIKRSGRTKEMIKQSRSSMSIKDMVNRNSGSGFAGEGSRSPIAPSTSASSLVSDHDGRDPRSLTPGLIRPGYDRSPATAPSRMNGLSNSSSNSGLQHALSMSSSTSQDSSILNSSGPIPNFRIQSFQSASSTAQKSDSFDLERGASIRSNNYYNHEFGSGIAVGSGSTGGGIYSGVSGVEDKGQQRAVSGAISGERQSSFSFNSNSSAPGVVNSDFQQQATPTGQYQTSFGRNQNQQYPSQFQYDQQYGEQEQTPQPGRQDHGNSSRDDVDDEKEWDELKPYLSTQSSTLVNSIQNLLAAIRTGGNHSALDQHLSEVIAVSSSIVAICKNALPSTLRAEGDPLLADLVSNTNRLSEAQQEGGGSAPGGSSSSHSGGSGGIGYEKVVRQQIASASFGVAKALKALMKVGGAD